tara:strand:+ start:874 stop:1098 length:225 start_codon:yes stop_codon:yes gene_type:complete
MTIDEVIDECDAMREKIDGTDRYGGLSYTVMRCIEFAYLEGLKTASKTLLEHIKETQHAVETRQLEEDKELFES